MTKTARFCILLVLLSLLTNGRMMSQSCPHAVDYIDPTYGSRIRHLQKPDGHEHNIYYHRNPFNADTTYLIGIQSDLNQENWRVVLYDADGCLIKNLFTLAQYDWRLVWDRNDPAILYTWKGSNLYRYNVNTGEADLLKSFAPLGLKPSGPSLNQAGDRILVITSDGTLRSYRLPDMEDERAFKVSSAAFAGCVLDWEDMRYIGYQDFIAVKCASDPYGAIYHDDGRLYYESSNFPLGHSDFSPDGQWAYIKRVTDSQGRGGLLSWEVHVVNLDGSNDRLLYSVPRPQALSVRNLHISWPDRDRTRFFVSFFPNATVPPTYVPPLDEILQVNLDGTHAFLARTGTDPTVLFWAQPLASPSSDGSRISFNSNRSGTIDQYILFVDHVH